MLLIYNEKTNPFFNLAMEEYLLKNFDEDIFILWRNESSVIVGKNQNTLSEINLNYIKENSIPVVRRQSGGGAVFHDLGNINFTFIVNNNDKSGIRFKTKLYNDGDEIVTKGTLIIPANLLEKGQALTLDTPKVAISTAKVLYEQNKEENYVTYLGTIVSVPHTQFDRQMTASSFVTYKDKAGNEYTVYAPYEKGSISINELLNGK